MKVKHLQLHSWRPQPTNPAINFLVWGLMSRREGAVNVAFGQNLNYCKVQSDWSYTCNLQFHPLEKYGPGTIGVFH